MMDSYGCPSKASRAHDFVCFAPYEESGLGVVHLHSADVPGGQMRRIKRQRSSQKSWCASADMRTVGNHNLEFQNVHRNLD